MSWLYSNRKPNRMREDKTKTLSLNHPKYSKTYTSMQWSYHQKLMEILGCAMKHNDTLASSKCRMPSKSITIGKIAQDTWIALCIMRLNFVFMLCGLFHREKLDCLRSLCVLVKTEDVRKSQVKVRMPVCRPCWQSLTDHMPVIILASKTFPRWTTSGLVRQTFIGEAWTHC